MLVNMTRYITWRDIEGQMPQDRYGTLIFAHPHRTDSVSSVPHDIVISNYALIVDIAEELFVN